MTDHLLNRIEHLEKGLRRWRLATFVLGLLLICSIAVGGTMNLLLMLELPRREEIMMERERAEDALREAQQAQQRAEQAVRDIQNAKEHAHIAGEKEKRGP